MKTESELRKQAIALHLPGWKKSEIARKMQRSRAWVVSNGGKRGLPQFM